MNGRLLIMLRRLLLSALLLLSLAAPAFAIGNVLLSVGYGARIAPITACPKGGGYPTDGCSGAPAPLTAAFYQPGAFQPGGYFNTTAGTTANYMATDCTASGTALCRPPENVAGADYAIGYFSAYSALRDPAVNVSTNFPGCTYSTTAWGGGLLTCGGTGSGFSGLIQHINLGPIGSHGCTALQINGTTGVTSFTLDDFYWFNDTGLCSFTQGGGAAAIYAGSTLPGGVTLSNGIMDGNGDVFDTAWGGCASGTECNPGNIALSDGANNVTLKYMVLENFPGDPLHPGTASTSTFLIQYSVIKGWCNRAPSCHTEWLAGALSSQNITVDHTVILQKEHASPYGPGGFFYSDNYPATPQSVNFTNNTVVNAFLGGGNAATVKVSGCMGSQLTGGTSAAPTCDGTEGNIFYLTCLGSSPSCDGSAGGNWGDGYGSLLNCPGSATVLYKKVPGTYPIIQSGKPNIIGEWEMDGFSSAFYYPNYTQNGQCQGVTVSLWQSNWAISNADGNIPLGAGNFSGNFIDVSSSYGVSPTIAPPNGPQIWDIGEYHPEEALNVTISGGVTMTINSGTSVQIRVGAYMNGVSNGLCSSLLTCPTLTAGSGGTTGGSWTLSSPVTNGTYNIAIAYPAQCLTPTVFAGNHDMTAQMSDANLNQYSNNGNAPDTFGCF